MERIITTLSIILCFAAAGIAQAEKTGKIVGSIFDPNDAVILGTEVTVSSGSFSRSAFPEPRSGEFSFDVPAGVYTITTKRTQWFEVRRASFIVRAGETVMIDLRPRLYLRSQALVFTNKGLRDVYEYAPQAKGEEFLPFSDSPMNVFVEFETKQMSGNITEYREATLTYNDLSISANLIQVDRKALSVEATGRVTSDRDGTHKKSRSIKLKIERIAN
ncbi:MAG: carboxypeptidase regulatory-like domain-containing protein [Acidobacteria bacterium]|nr:carboxypeptidase regulatory-like domain-containing protein [Acidobacteriota bacterium]